LNSIESCASASSAQELGIQLADLAAGLFGRVCRDVCLQRQPSAELYRIAESWSGTLFDMKRHYVMVSDVLIGGHPGSETPLMAAPCCVNIRPDGVGNLRVI
jgi:hypothetical protein